MRSIFRWQGVVELAHDAIVRVSAQRVVRLIEDEEANVASKVEIGMPQSI